MFDDKYKHVARLLFTLDMFIAIFAMVVAYHLRVTFVADSVTVKPAHVALVPLVAILFAWGQSFAGSYRRLRISLFAHVWVVISGLAFALGALLSLLFFVFHEDLVSRLIILGFSVIVFILSVLSRWMLVWWYFKRDGATYENRDRVLIIGTGERAERIAEVLSTKSEWGTEIIGFLDIDESMVGNSLKQGKVIGLVSDIEKILRDNVVDEVVIAVPRTMIDKVGKIFASCEEEGVKIRLMSDVFDFQVARMRLNILGGIPLLSFEPVAQSEFSLLIKRIVDIIAVIASLPLVAPLCLLVAFVIKLDSRGPAIFVQQRVGLTKRIFSMYKFRSMVTDAEAKMKEIEHLNEASGPNFKIADDPRVTKVGKFIRKTSLDELPQLLNVLLGDMTLVGPRPMSLRDVNLFDSGLQRKRFSVKPGLTCLWQISGRSNLSFEKWLELDLTYIDNWSLALDLEILLKTIPVLLKREGAV